MKNVWRNLAIAGLVLAAAAAPALAQPITVAPGNDSWTTPANSSTIDLGVFPLDLIFGPSPTVNPQVVSLSGVPLNPGGLGAADTLLERYPPSVTFVGIPETHTFSVEIKALRLKGQTTVNGVGFDVYVALSSVASGPGTITATRQTADGGRFNSSFPVQPKLIFIQHFVGTRSEIDCGLVSGCPGIVLNSSNNCWEVAFGPNNFNPANFGIPPINAGVPVDSDFDGVNDYVTVGRKRAGFAGLEFHVGRFPAPPWGVCADSVHDHAVYSLTHVSRVPDDCKPRTGTTTGTTRTTSSDFDVVANSRLCASITTIDDVEPVDDEPVVVTNTGATGLKKQPAGTKPGQGKPRQGGKPKR